MIYSSETDIVPFLKGLVQSIIPYAKVHEVQISFSTAMKKQAVLFNPFLLSQSLVQLTCNIINLLPPKSTIETRLLMSTDNQNLLIEIENNNLNLIWVNEITPASTYSFTGNALINGTLYTISLPLNNRLSTENEFVLTNTSSNNLPQFYRKFKNGCNRILHRPKN
ncbi:MAG: hypothetical protein IPF54_25855 [Draconibacterium sp.]|nr:hypothetical protein [Draconibacterium sp.]